MADSGSVPAGPAEPTPAATVIPLRDGPSGIEVLMLRRNSRGAFGGMWVFPGGQVDPSDLPGHPAAGDEIAAARRAAVREAQEEAGIDLDPDSLVVLSFWLPPPEAPRRFATWFFVAPIDHGADVTVDRGEIREHRWFTPAGAMAARHGGEIELAPPTFTTLWWLGGHADTSAVLAAAGSRAPERFETHVALGREGAVRATLWAGDAGYEDGDLDRPGPRRRLVMDPAGWRVEISS
ncbi:MAG TPA: NUDIX hydrolase [Acidimicrobiales bacterium]|nr:NUDIX hydrolase [Acidimicrobiales bacterium]